MEKCHVSTREPRKEDSWLHLAQVDTGSRKSIRYDIIRGHHF